MPLWLVIMIAGATGCGYLFLKARESEVEATYKKVTGRSKTVRKAAGKAALRPSFLNEHAIAEKEPKTSTEQVFMSRSSVDIVAEEETNALPEVNLN